MSGPSAIAIASRLLLLALLLGSLVGKPSMVFAVEIHELTEHAAAGDEHGHGHDHELDQTLDGAPAPDDSSDGDDHWHLSHCCGHQAAMLPRLDIGLLTPTTASPVAPMSVAFAPSPLTAPFRPPITA